MNRLCRYVNKPVIIDGHTGTIAPRGRDSHYRFVWQDAGYIYAAIISGDALRPGPTYEPHGTKEYISTGLRASTSEGCHTGYAEALRKAEYAQEHGWGTRR